MTGNDLLRALNDISDDLIMQADDGRGIYAESEKDKVVSIASGRSRLVRGSMKFSSMLIGVAAAAVILVSVTLNRGALFGAKASSVNDAGVVAEGTVTANEADMAAEDEVVEKAVEITDERAASDDGIRLGAVPAGAAAEEDTADEEDAAYTEEAEEEAAADFAVNPFREYVSMTECEKATGLALDAPDEFAGSVSRVIRADDGGLVEVIYESELGEELFRIRKGTGGDVSGDYNTYAYEDGSLKADDGCCYQVSGDAEDCLQLVTWTRDGFSYSANAGIYLLSNEDALALVNTVK